MSRRPRKEIVADLKRDGSDWLVTPTRTQRLLTEAAEEIDELESLEASQEHNYFGGPCPHGIAQKYLGIVPT